MTHALALGQQLPLMGNITTLRNVFLWGMMAHACDLSMWEDLEGKTNLRCCIASFKLDSLG